MKALSRQARVCNLAGKTTAKVSQMPKMTYVVPPNLSRLWSAEDEMMVWATQVIASEEYLQDHLELIEAYIDCVETVRR